VGPNTPYYTAVALAVGGLLLALCCGLSRVSGRLGVPAALIFLVVGMLAGSDGVGGIWFDEYDVANLWGTIALVFILYSGGLQTRTSSLGGSLVPASVLATIGVLGIAAVTALGARAIGLSWNEALLFGAIVSSTDAAAVFAVLAGVKLPQRIARTIELESGMNDPVAVILTMAMTANMLGTEVTAASLVPLILQQLGVGLACGGAIGWLGKQLLVRLPLSAPALYPVLTLSFGMVAYGLPTVLNGSGFISVYIAGILIGNAKTPFSRQSARFHDSFAWLSQVSMFLMLGLLVFPSHLPGVAGTGVALALFLAFVARPLVVSLCLLPFRFRLREVVYISWIGLRGSVPIILATVPVLNAQGKSLAMQDALNIFDLVFFVVLVGAILPGATVRWLTRKLHLDAPAPAAAASPPSYPSSAPSSPQTWTPA
jgi:potassium/hydrogen antiporter